MKIIIMTSVFLFMRYFEDEKRNLNAKMVT